MFDLTRYARRLGKSALYGAARRKTAYFLSRAALYVILITLTYVFLQPFIMMVLYSVKPAWEVQDVTLIWLSRNPSLKAFGDSVKALSYFRSLWNSLFLALVPTAGHVLSASMAGYAFARLRLRGGNALFMLVLLTLIVPTQTVIIPTFGLFSSLSTVLGEALPFLKPVFKSGFLPLTLPAFFGMGLKAALYIFIYRQTYAAMPGELEDAARVDGCNIYQSYVRIMFPLARSATLVVVILSIIWRWNDYAEPQVYLQNDFITLPMQLPNLFWSFDHAVGSAVELFNVTAVMNAALIILLPMILFYLVIQRWFMQGIETTGIVG